MLERKTVGQLMEEMRLKAGAQNYHGHEYMDLERFAEDTRHMIIFPMGSLSVMTGLPRSFPGRAPQSVSGSFWRAASLPPMWSLQKRQAMNAPSLQKNFGICTTISAIKPEIPGICPVCPVFREPGSRKKLHGLPSS